MIKKIKNRGFTVLESIVAIGILSLSISGAFSAVQQSFSQAIIAKDEVKAFYLAQEAMEIIRNKRDANQLYKIANPSTSNTWLDGIAQVGDPCQFGKTCRVYANPPSAPALVDCAADPGGVCPVLKQDPVTYIYGYTSGDATNFKREIQIESINANEIAVTVQVSWKKGILDMNFKVKEHLFNWI
jgi:type II secretory pathway pseudopilin PulG